MAVVPFKNARRRKASLRNYVYTDAGVFRLSGRLAHEIAVGAVEVPKFANSMQRFIEVFIEREGSVVQDARFRATHARFDAAGKVSFDDAVEAWALFLQSKLAKNHSDNIVDLGPKLEAARL